MFPPAYVMAAHDELRSMDAIRTIAFIISNGIERYPLEEVKNPWL